MLLYVHVGVKKLCVDASRYMACVCVCEGGKGLPVSHANTHQAIFVHQRQILGQDPGEPGRYVLDRLPNCWWLGFGSDTERSSDV